MGLPEGYSHEALDRLKLIMAQSTRGWPFRKLYNVPLSCVGSMHKSWNSMNQLPWVPLVVVVQKAGRATGASPALGVGSVWGPGDSGVAGPLRGGLSLEQSQR